MTTPHRSWRLAAIPNRRSASHRPDRGRTHPLLQWQPPRPTVWLTLSLLAAAAVCGAVLPSKAFGDSEAEAGSLFAHLSWGADEDQVGLVEVQEGLTRGPEALAVAPDGRVAVLDSVNCRLVLLDASGVPLGAIALDLAQPRFLAVDDQALYVLDSEVSKVLATYSWSGDLVDESPAPETEDLATGLFATSEGPCVELAHDRSLLMAGKTVQTLPGRPVDRGIGLVVSASYKPPEGVRLRARSLSHADAGQGAGAAPGASVADSTAAGQAAVTAEVELTPGLASGAAIDHLVSLDGDGHGGLLLGARLLRPQTRGGVTSCLAITRLSSSDLEGSSPGLRSRQGESGPMLLLRESDFAYLGAPYAVAPDGRIFQPIADRSGYTILVHTFEEVRP